MNRTTLYRTAALLLIGSATSASAQGTDHAAEMRKRNACRLAAQVLNSGHPQDRQAWARATIIGCVDEGPAYVSAQWTTVPADTTALRALIAGSTNVRDARVYARLRETAADAARPDPVRVAAMIALAQYVDPTIAIDLSELRVPDGPVERIRFFGGSAVDVVHVRGAQPVGDVSAEVRALLDRIAADRSGEPREVWYAAAVLSRRVGSYRRVQTP
jgi:hypothetical protein